MKISEHLQDYLTNFKVRYPATLFEPSFEEFRDNLRAEKCPICHCKLYESRQSPIWYCRSKKHKSFVIRKGKYEKIIE